MGHINLPAPSPSTGIELPKTIAPPTATMAGGGLYRLGGGDPDKMGFKSVSKDKKQGLFLIIVGRQGSGKNSLAYSAVSEGPVLELEVIERGVEGDAHMQQYVGNVRRKAFLQDPDADPLALLQSKKIFEEFRRTMMALYGFPGTIIINTIDEMYEIGRMALQEKLVGVLQRDYGPINRALNDIFMYFTRKECPTNLILLSKGYDLWKDNQNTGKMAYKGFPNAMYLSDGAIFMDKKEPEYVNGELVPLPPEQRFTGVIHRCPGDTKQEGVILKGNLLTFSVIKSRMIP